MGLMGKLAGKALGSALESTLEKTVEIAYKKGALDGVYNQYQKAIGQKTERELIATNSLRYQLVINKEVSYNTGLSLDMECNSYYVSNQFGSPLYYVKGSAIKGAHHFTIYNNQNIALGVIKKRYIALPFICEKDARECTIELNNNEIASIRSYTSGKERCFNVSGKLTIKSENHNTNFTIKKGKNTIAYLHKSLSKFSQMDNHNYVLEYDDKDIELGCLLIAICIDITAHA